MPRETPIASETEAIAAGSVSAAPEAGLMGRVVDKVAYVFAAGIVLAAAILLLEVFLRYVFNSPTIWAHETTIFLCGIAFVFGGLYCTCRNTHIRVVLLYDNFSPGLRRVADITISLVSALASAFFAYAAYHMVERAVITPSGAVRLETTGSAWSPPTPALIKIFILITMVLLVLQFLILAFNYAKRKPRD
ncbi:C4-dicarboxylate ABC transporter permease [Phyllobacterium phragmitis]|uniref:TRAP transporter small permease protein n=1 Tax=Phyllobacterium phragmitis TaxID=2670329 RepID=A0A2S9IWC2_9HYPH|nr:TRAP transporter small permease subunit [Phyllobacterium phragmitis]PRD44825.1 C4-dicarboxylate ABC transporter permease [Phyllobacterium phragmitis]